MHYLGRALTLAAALCLLGAPYRAEAAPTASTGRTYFQGNFNAAFTPNLALSILPATRYEYTRTPGESTGHYQDEFFVGPTVNYAFGDFTLKGSLWYYLTSSYAPSGNTRTQNVELIPTLEYRTGPWRFSERLMFHNILHSTAYKTSTERNGYSLALRSLTQVRRALSPEWGVSAAVEPFLGLVEDGEAPVNNSGGFWGEGLRLNRIYLGFDWRAAPNLTVAPQYIMETVHSDDEGVMAVHHYLYVTLSYTLVLY